MPVENLAKALEDADLRGDEDEAIRLRTIMTSMGMKEQDIETLVKVQKELKTPEEKMTDLQSQKVVMAGKGLDTSGIDKKLADLEQTRNESRFDTYMSSLERSSSKADALERSSMALGKQGGAPLTADELTKAIPKMQTDLTTRAEKASGFMDSLQPGIDATIKESGFGSMDKMMQALGSEDLDTAKMAAEAYTSIMNQIKVAEKAGTDPWAATRNMMNKWNGYFKTMSESVWISMGIKGFMALLVASKIGTILAALGGELQTIVGVLQTIGGWSGLTSLIPGLGGAAAGGGGGAAAAGGGMSLAAAAGPIAAAAIVAMGAWHGYSDAEAAGRTKLGGTVYGALTGGAKTGGGLLGEKMGYEKGSAGDEMVGLGEATAYGAGVGALAGAWAGPPGMLIGGAIGASVGFLAEMTKIFTAEKSNLRDEIVGTLTGGWDKTQEIFMKSQQSWTDSWNKLMNGDVLGAMKSAMEGWIQSWQAGISAIASSFGSAVDWVKGWFKSEEDKANEAAQKALDDKVKANIKEHKEKGYAQAHDDPTNPKFEEWKKYHGTEAKLTADTDAIESATKSGQKKQFAEASTAALQDALSMTDRMHQGKDAWGDTIKAIEDSAKALGVALDEPTKALMEQLKTKTKEESLQTKYRNDVTRDTARMGQNLTPEKFHERVAELRGRDLRTSLTAEAAAGDSGTFNVTAQNALSDMDKQKTRYGALGVDQWSETINALRDAQKKGITLTPEVEKGLEVLEGKSRREFKESYVRQDYAKQGYVVGATYKGHEVTQEDYNKGIATNTDRLLKDEGFAADGTKIASAADATKETPKPAAVPDATKVTPKPATSTDAVKTPASGEPMRITAENARRKLNESWELPSSSPLKPQLRAIKEQEDIQRLQQLKDNDLVSGNWDSKTGVFTGGKKADGTAVTTLRPGTEDAITPEGVTPLTAKAMELLQKDFDTKFADPSKVDKASDSTVKLTEVATKPGSIYVHDMYVEKIVAAILAVLTGNKVPGGQPVDDILANVFGSEESLPAEASYDPLGVFDEGQPREALDAAFSDRLPEMPSNTELSSLLLVNNKILESIALMVKDIAIAPMTQGLLPGDVNSNLASSYAENNSTNNQSSVQALADNRQASRRKPSANMQSMGLFDPILGGSAIDSAYDAENSKMLLGFGGAMGTAYNGGDNSGLPLFSRDRVGGMYDDASMAYDSRKRSMWKPYASMQPMGLFDQGLGGAAIGSAYDADNGRMSLGLGGGAIGPAYDNRSDDAHRAYDSRQRSMWKPYASMQPMGLFDPGLGGTAIGSAYDVDSSRTLLGLGGGAIGPAYDNRSDDASRAYDQRQRSLTKPYASMQPMGLFDQGLGGTAIGSAYDADSNKLSSSFGAMGVYDNTGGGALRRAYDNRSDDAHSAYAQRQRSMSRPYTSMQSMGLFDPNLGSNAISESDNNGYQGLMLRNAGFTAGHPAMAGLDTPVGAAPESERIRNLMEKRKLVRDAKAAASVLNTGLFDDQNNKNLGMETMTSLTSLYGRDLNSNAASDTGRAGAVSASNSLYYTDEQNSQLGSATVLQGDAPKGQVSTNLVSMDDAESYVSRVLEGDKPTGSNVLLPGIDAILDYLSDEAAKREQKIIELLEQIRDGERTSQRAGVAAPGSDNISNSTLRNWSRETLTGLWKEYQQGGFAEQNNNSGDIV